MCEFQRSVCIFNGAYFESYVSEAKAGRTFEKHIVCGRTGLQYEGAALRIYYN